MQKYESYFTYKDYESDIDHGVVQFRYELGHLGNTYEFTETLSFNPLDKNRNIGVDDQTLTAIFDSLHILLGISYWKLVCPKDIRLSSQQLTQKQAQFWNTVYTKGLGEFYYRNSIDFRDLVQFPFTEKTTSIPGSKTFSNRSLVLLGSGKDSIVSSELLKKSHKDFTLFSLNAKNIHKETAGLIGKPFIDAKRVLDSKLLELNKEPGFYNGHVPITAITSFAGLFMAYMYDFRYIIMSNEETANYGNVEYHGSIINHQWSKTLEFETLFRDYVREHISGDLVYFSLLRPFTEAAIMKQFIKHSQYFDQFTSCNKNFTLSEAGPPVRWCGVCPKCAFVFLLLAGFLPKEKVISILHKNLFADKKLIPTYKELLGIEGIKPFECVGTPEEVLFTFSRILANSEYNDDVVVKELSPQILSLAEDKKVSPEKIFGFSEKNCIPPEFTEVVKTYET